MSIKKVAEIIRKLNDAGRLGKKTGRGFSCTRKGNGTVVPGGTRHNMQEKIGWIGPISKENEGESL